MAEEENEERPKRRRRWKRWVFGLFLLFLIGLVWLAGPGARMAIAHFLPGILENQKLSGDYTIEGNLYSGLTLKDVDLDGESKLKKVEAAEVQVGWSPGSLFKKQLEEIVAKDLRVVIAPDAPPLPEKEKKESETSLTETLNLVRGLIEPSVIEIENLSVEVEGVTELSLGALRHEPNEDTYRFIDLRGQDHLGREVVNEEMTLTWTEEVLGLDKMKLHPELSLEDLVFRPEEAGSLKLMVADAQLEVKSDLKKEHQIELLSANLNLGKAAAIYDPDLKIGGVLSQLKIDTAEGLVLLDGKDFQYGEQKLASARIEARAEDITKPFGSPIKLDADLAGQLQLGGEVTLNEDLLKSEADLDFTLTDERIPKVTGSVNYLNETVDLVASALEGLKLEARYRVPEQKYEANLSSDLAKASVLHPLLRGPLKFSTDASGDLQEKRHEGTLDLGSLQLEKEGLPDARMSGQVSWDWPEKVEIEGLTMRAPEGVLELQAAWQDAVLRIDSLTLADQNTKLLTANGRFPAPLEAESLQDRLSSNEPISLQVNSQPLTFEKLSSFAPIPENLRAVLQADLNLTGSFAAPELNGYITVNDFRIADQDQVPPADLTMRFRTENQQLILDSKVTEPGGPLLDIEGTLPFKPREWVDKAPDPEAIPLDFRAFSPEMPLSRFQAFVPAITEANGTIKLDLRARGTLTKPDLSGSMTANIQRLRIPDSPISEVRESFIRIAFTDEEARIETARINAAGGDIELGGSVTFADKTPTFDLTAKGKHFLLTRTPDYTFRGHPDLALKGTLEQASITGSLAIVESLYYKDVEILPFGVPRTTDIPEPSLPKFASEPPPPSSEENASGGSFKNWQLDIKVTTKDAILIRGNLARGKVIGDARVFGTIGDPKTSGTLTTEELSLDLPFSELKVDRGVINLRPEDITNPRVDVRGSSTVGEYEIQIFVSGLVQNPELTFVSNPPLPQSEIMLLLATGSASAQLEDRQVASQKALQYLLEGIRRRNAGRDKTVLQRLLKNSDQIQLSLGDTNQFSGRTFSSASLELGDQWDFVTQIDEEGQTRALVVFSLRFK